MGVEQKLDLFQWIDSFVDLSSQKNTSTETWMALCHDAVEAYNDNKNNSVFCVSLLDFQDYMVEYLQYLEKGTLCGLKNQYSIV